MDWTHAGLNSLEYVCTLIHAYMVKQQMDLSVNTLIKVSYDLKNLKNLCQMLEITLILEIEIECDTAFNYSSMNKKKK